MKEKKQSNGSTSSESPSQADVNALRAEVEALREENENLRVFADNMFELETHGVFLVDETNNRIIKANAAASSMYGYDKAELEKKAIPELSMEPEAAMESIRSRHTFMPLRLHKNKNGATFPIEASIKYFTWQGKPMRFTAIRDISLREAALEKLRLAETIVENSPVALFLCKNAPGRPIEYASANVHRFGYHPRKLLDQGVLFEDLIHPGDRRRVAEELAARTAKGETRFTLRYRLLARNGETRYVEENVFVQDDPSQGVAHLQGAVIDVTELTEAQLSQKESQALFHGLFNAVQEAIYVLDGAYRILILNEAGPRNHGLSRGEMIGEVYPAFFDPANEKRIARKLERVLARNTPVRFVSQLGERVFDNVAYPVPGEDGRPIQIAVYSRDITRFILIRDKLKTAKRTADEANRAKSDYLASMSHEIRTPIHAINGMVDLLLEDAPAGEAKKRLSRIKETAAHLNGLISNILDLSKIEHGRLELERAAIDLHSLMDGAAADMRDLAEQKGLSLNLAIAPDAPRYVYGDPLRIRQILFNLGANAVKFTETGGISLRLDKDRTASSSAGVVFTVTDTGIGMDLDQFDSIFETFRQADESHARKYGGSGLGLAICRQLAEIMGGGVSVTSRKGQGSVFTVRAALEKAPPPESPSPSRETGRTAPGGSVRRILLAEDNPVNAEIALESFKRAGHESAWAENGLRAITLLAANAFDVICMDVEMPLVDGIEAAKRIRSGEAGPDRRAIPIIGVTAHALSDVRKQCLDAGMNACVTKPVDFKNLLSLIDGFFNQGAEPESPKRPSSPLRSGSSEGILNREQALARLQGNTGLYEKILRGFIERAPESIASLRESVLGSAHADAAAKAHAFAGSLAAIGAETSYALAKGLVKAAREENDKQVEILFTLLEEEVEKVISLSINVNR